MTLTETVAKLPLSEVLPQADSMILLTDYTLPSDDVSAEAFVSISEDSPFYEYSLRGVPSCIALEYMAQTMALYTGLSRLRTGAKPRLGFILGSRKLDVYIDVFECTQTYKIKVECIYNDESFGSFNCAIVDSLGNIVAEGVLSAFQPSDDIQLDKLRELK